MNFVKNILITINIADIVKTCSIFFDPQFRYPINYSKK
jgi:hypothetical protein